MTWRSFRDHTEDKRAAITSDWKVIGYPTLYLIDHHGIIRKRWIGGPTPEELTHMTAVLIDAARRNIGLEAMHAVVAALRLSPAPKAIMDPPANGHPIHAQHGLSRQGLSRGRRLRGEVRRVRTA